MECFVRLHPRLCFPQQQPLRSSSNPSALSHNAVNQLQRPGLFLQSGAVPFSLAGIFVASRFRAPVIASPFQEVLVMVLAGEKVLS